MKTLKARVTRKARYRGLMAEGRCWVKISPPLIPWVKRFLDENPGQLNGLVNRSLADFFDRQAARDKLDAEARAGVGDG